MSKVRGGSERKCPKFWVETLKWRSPKEQWSCLENLVGITRETATPHCVCMLGCAWLFTLQWRPLQSSCLENPMDGGAWWAAVHGVAESGTTEWLPFHFSLSCIGEGNGNPLQCFCLENPRDGGAWWATIYGVAQSRTRLKWLSSSSIEIEKKHTKGVFSLQR